VFPVEHPRIYLNATERARLTSALDAGTPSAVRFRQMIDAQLVLQNIYDFKAWHAALLYVLTGNEVYGDYALTLVDQRVQGEEARIASGQLPEVAADSYLHVGDRIGDLALTFDYCHDRLTPEQRDRWIKYADQAVWNVWHHDQAEWGGAPAPWAGWSVDDPGNNYYFSFLRATMLLGLATRGESANADAWLTTFRDEKLGARLVPTFATELYGGGSREGTGYGVTMAGLFQLYDIWEKTTGERLADLTPHARQSMLHMLHSIVPTRDRVAPIGDQARESTAALFDYHRDYLQVLGALYPSEPATEVMRDLLPTTTVKQMLLEYMFYSDFFYDTTGLPTRPIGELHPTYFSPGTGHLFLRSGWDTSATWAAFIAGPYTESHAHRDQGSFLLYKKGWLAYDANVDSHSGIQQGEEQHNLVRIVPSGGIVPMRQGAPPAVPYALHDDVSHAYFAADITPVYDGQQPIVRLEREVVFVKPDVFIVYDRVEASDPSPCSPP
jgi:hypothetical protein